MESRGFIEGYMPVQMLAELAILVGSLIFATYLLEKRYRITINKFFQATGLLILAVAYLKYRVYPPMPFSTLAIYTVTIAIGIFLWVSANEKSWREFCSPIFAVTDGTTRTTRRIRFFALILLPILIGILGFNIWKPDKIETPVELRTYHPAPPASFKVYSPEDFAKDRSGK